MPRRLQPAAMNSGRRLQAGSQQFDRWLEECWLAAGSQQEIRQQVAETIAAVEGGGDRALLELTARLDGWSPAAAADLRIDSEEIDRAASGLAADDRAALAAAAGRISRYHSRQLPQTHEFEDEAGNRIMRRWSALASVAVYVPGGGAAYPSSLLMAALPAAAAGVERMVFATPGGSLNPWVAHAAQLAGIGEGLRIGGAQAIAALALGTETIGRVDKIAGPGNTYVTEAKRQLTGRVGIDLLAGPSELVVVGDGTAPSEWTAADLAAQAEHGPDSKVALISTSSAELEEVGRLLERIVGEAADASGRGAQLSQSLANAALIDAADLQQARQAANRIAAEHLQLSIADAHREMEREWVCGCLCAGSRSAVALSDYCAGSSHILPTSGRVRFSSGLSVTDFMRATSIFAASSDGAAELAAVAVRIAQGEGLGEHARSAQLRTRQG